MSMKNDIAFILNCNMYLYEHQSSINPNMPLRDLIYVSKELEKYINDRNMTHSLYHERKMKIPTPRFVIFYNGKDEQPERTLIKLSDLFMDNTKEPELELKVLQLNINVGYNETIVEACEDLKGYCQYVDTVRRYAKEIDIKLAVEKAIDECIAKGILEEFLINQRSEVKAMSIFEYNEEIEMKKIRALEYNDGVQKGKEEGIQIGEARGEAKTLISTITHIMKKSNVTLEEACEIIDITVDQYNAKKELLCQIEENK